MEEIQKTILTMIFLYPEVRYKIFKKLNGNHFNNQYKTIFNSCQKLYKKNKEIDPLIVMSDIGNEYMSLIASLTDITLIKKPNVDEYIKVLTEDYNKREAIFKTKNLLLQIEKGELPQEKIQEGYLSISKVFNSESEDTRIFDTVQGFSMVLDELESKKEYIQTGFKKLDELVLIDKGDMIVIAGKPSSGKTTIATNMMMNISAKYNVLFFSIETSAVKIYKKIASSAARINYKKILKSEMYESDYSSFLGVANEFSNHKLKVVEAAGMSVNDIISISLQNKADIIFIDYLQIVADKSDKSSYERVSNISRELHTFAQKEKITVVALSQLKRTDNRQPTMSDLRESGQIEQDADAIIFIHNPNNAEQQDISNQYREVIIGKNKQGEIGSIDYKFHGSVQTFKED